MKVDFFAKLIPDGVKHMIYQYVSGRLMEMRVKEEEAIPRRPLSSDHIKNTRMLLDREELLSLLPSNAVVAELGVDRGKFTEKIRSIANPKKLHLIDLWGSERYNEDKKTSVHNKFKEEIASGLIEINLGLSTAVVDQFEDNYFDWIYIDTDHGYTVTAEELKKYHSKMKPGGIIAGHDYILGNWRKMIRYGVIEAVYEFCVEHDWEIIYLTMEIDNNPSFAIRKR